MTAHRITIPLLAPVVLALALGCQNGEGRRVTDGPDLFPASLSSGLVISIAVVEKGPDGWVPQPARLGVLTRQDGKWSYRTIEDPDSNVFHKAMVYEPESGRPGLLTAGGTRAILKLWRKGTEARFLWEADFGGKFSRMRDIEIADVYGDGSAAIVVATHDQGVVAIVTPDGSGGFTAQELDREANTIVHEIEIGDLDSDGVPEIYATPSLPNKLDGSPQPGQVVRYVPARGEGRTVVADLGDRHAKEILVSDVDGDGRDELYVSVEAVDGGRVRILRFDAETPATAGREIAAIHDTLCRFLTAGDVDGDGRKEMIAASHKGGIWLLRPADDPEAEWSKELVDGESSGFEHASILTDLDGDGVDELYVASDDSGEVNVYVWRDGTPLKSTIHRQEEGFSGFFWNIMPVPLDVIP